MSTEPTSTGLSITLDQLAALNDEMAALARAGVPLDRGLLHVGGDLPGRLGRITRDIGQRLEQGETIEQVLSDESLPTAYRAVVAAGRESMARTRSALPNELVRSGDGKLPNAQSMAKKPPKPTKPFWQPIVQ